ncbi:MAG TPA: hypothetical protein VG013_13095, partial [Gemmataceae bacterium]|nr:hypothetical protein [Gemmataceae bacterium]
HRFHFETSAQQVFTGLAAAGPRLLDRGSYRFVVIRHGGVCWCSIQDLIRTTPALRQRAAV